jgi:hypothetical protein
MIKINIILFSFLLSSLALAQQIIFREDFQHPNALSNWKISNEDGLIPNENVSEYATSAWITVVDPNNPNDTVVSSTSYFTSPGKANRWLISPAITLGDFGNVLSWDAKSFDPSFPEDYKILISTTNNNINSFYDTLGLFISENYNWNSKTFSLSEMGLNNKTIYIAFVHTSYDAFKLYFDDIEVRSEDNLSVSKIANNTSTIYPNPVSEILNLTNKSITKIHLYAIDGKKIPFDFKPLSNKLDLSFLTQGIYFIELFGENGSEKFQFVKE